MFSSLVRQKSIQVRAPCLDKAMQSSHAGLRMNDLEIDEPGIVATDMQPVRKYGAAV